MSQTLKVRLDDLTEDERREFKSAYESGQPIRYQGQVWIIRSRPVVGLRSGGASAHYQLVATGE